MITKMSIENSCGMGSSSPFCVCTDLYGDVMPEYRYHNASETYACCNQLPNYQGYDPTAAVAGSEVLGYVQNAQGGTSCGGFITAIQPASFYDSDDYTGVSNDAQLKKFFPLLYWQGAFNASLFNTTKFTGAATFTDNTISCANAADIPYFVSYPNYYNSAESYKVLCGSSNLENLKDIKYINDSTIELEYSISYVQESGGGDCKTQSCNVKYDTNFFNEYNIGNRAYKSSGKIAESNALTEWWMWMIVLGVIIIISIVLYYIYYSGMEKYFKNGVRYLNGLTKGKGDVAKKHALLNKHANLHMDT